MGDKKTSSVIKLKDVCKYYYMGDNVVKAVNRISLEVRRGEFIAIMGPSGSGKSTLMNLIGSLDIPTSGTVYLDSEDISSLSESDLAQIRGKKIGFIFQSFNLIPNLTTKENITLPMLFQGTGSIERNAKAEKLLDMVELTDRANHYPNELSGGQRQRVAIARSLINDPEIILADEPTGNLDTKTGNIVMRFLKKMHEKGRTIVMITHDPELAQEYAEIVYWLRDGELQKITKKHKGDK